MNAIKKLWMLMLALLLSVPAIAIASGDAQLDKAPGKLSDKASLQRGAKFFVTNCLACHSAAYMRYNRLMDIGIAESEIKGMLPEGGKLGSVMKAAMDAEAAKQAYGVAPPDLSVIARARGADWLYTYLRSFYVDSTRASGVNNVVFSGVGMPNIFASMQGDQELHVATRDGHETKTLKLVSPGSMTTAQFDATITDLTNYLDFMSDPSKLVRYNIGYVVLGFLFVLLALTYALKKEYWKDIH